MINNAKGSKGKNGQLIRQMGNVSRNIEIPRIKRKY